VSIAKPTDVQATKYAESFILYGEKTRALKAAFPQSKANQKTLNEEASRFHKIPKVCARVDELHKAINSEANDEALYTVSDALKELGDLAKKASKDKQFNPAVAAVMGKAKIAGLVIDKKDLSSSDGSMSPPRDFNDFYSEG